MAKSVASVPASPRLCETCRSIFQDSLQQSVPFPGKYLRHRKEDDNTRTSPFPHHRSKEDLYLSALQKCYFCLALVEKLQYSESSSKSGGSDVATSYFIWSDHMTDWKEDDPSQHINHFMRLSFAFGSGTEVTSEDTSLEYALFKTSELEFYRDDGIFLDNTGSLESWKVAQRWFEDCTRHHEKCRRGVGVSHERRLPSRLLSLSGHEFSTIYLQDTQDLSPSTEYATLSHRWGSSKVVILTSDSERELRKGIKTSTLSRTFQEAIVVSQKLGVEYLWIDSMCIFQDSRTDWEKESAMMGEVYRNSVCNIGATGSFNSDGGLFHERRPVNILPLSIDTKWSPETSIKEWAWTADRIELNGNYTIFEKDFWNKELSKAPLLSRGWVIQERILCPRMLHFGARQILWECLELDASEIYPHGRPDQDLAKHNLSSSSIYKPLKPLVDSNGIPDSRPPESIPAENFAIWKKVIYLSAGTSLTKSSDKLVSISGVAKSMRVPPDDQYLAGIWKSWIFGFLFWRVPDGRRPDGERSRRITPYVAPTWSWASLDAVIDYGVYSLYAIFITILETHIELATTDPTGQVLSGFLRLTGPVFTLRIPEPVRVSSDIDGVDLKTIREFDGNYLWGYYDQEEGQPIFLNDDSMKASLKPDIPFDHENKDLFFLATEFGWSFRMEGMILTYSDKDDGTFMRIGYLAINAVDSKERWTYEYENAWPKLKPLVREIILI